MNGNRTQWMVLFERHPDPLLVVGDDGSGWSIQSANGTFEERFSERPSLAEGTPEREALSQLGGVDRASTGPARRRTVEGYRLFEIEAIAGSGDDDVTRAFLRYADVTELRQQRQQIDVLNRVLRHDLRNDLNVITGYAELLEDAVTDRQATRLVRKIQDASQELVEIGRTARDAQLTERPSETRQLGTVLRQVRSRVRELAVDASVEIDPPDLDVRIDARLEPALVALYRQVCNHCEDSLETSIEGRTQGEMVELVVRIEDATLPDEELQPLEGGSETPLRHASGIGVWGFYWGVTAVGGITTVEVSDDRWVISATVPVLKEPIS